MKRYRRLLIGAICFLGVQGAAFAGGTVNPTIQDGPWDDDATWDLGQPDAASFHEAHIQHIVGLTMAGETAKSLAIGVAGAGTLNVSAGDLTLDTTVSVGIGDTGTLNVTLGTVSGVQLNIGAITTGTVEISGGLLSFSNSVSNAIDVGAGGASGTLKVVGTKFSIIASSSSAAGLNIGPNGTLIIEPVGNALLGLATIQVTLGSVVLNATSTLTLDISSYVPSVGDTWDVITAPDTITGSFGTLSAPTGFTITQTAVAARGVATPQKIVIEVTAAPAQIKWVDFAFGSGGNGSETIPYNTLALGLANVSAGGTLNIKGDKGTPTTSETPTINQDVTIKAINGTVTLGSVARSASKSGFESRAREH